MWNRTTSLLCAISARFNESYESLIAYRQIPNEGEVKSYHFSQAGTLAHKTDRIQTDFDYRSMDIIRAIINSFADREIIFSNFHDVRFRIIASGPSARSSKKVIRYITQFGVSDLGHRVLRHELGAVIFSRNYTREIIRAIRGASQTVLVKSMVMIPLQTIDFPR